MTMWLPRRRTSANPAASRILHTSRPERTRSLPNRYLDAGDEHFSMQAALDFARIRGFEKELQRFDQILLRRFNRLVLTCNIELRAQCHIPVVFPLNHGRQLVRRLHGSHCTVTVFSTSAGKVRSESPGGVGS